MTPLALLLYPPILMLVILVAIGAWYLLAPMLRPPAEGGVAKTALPAAAGAAQFTAERIMRLTDSGAAEQAALSSDGRYVVHVKRESDLPSVWVRQTATTSHVPIVPPADAGILGLAFSPDGTYVYYVTQPRGGGKPSLYKIPTLGGTPIPVLEDVASAPGFSPDGRRMAFVRGDTHLMVAAADGSGARSLTVLSGELRFTPERQTPAWSPNGRTILVPAWRGPYHSTALAVDVDTGVIREVSGAWVWLESVAWMPDGKSFIVDAATNRDPAWQLWQVGYPSGAKRRITTDVNGYEGVSLSTDGRLLVTVQTTTPATIWVVPAAGGEARALAVPSGRAPGADGLAWTPDGHHLVFTAFLAGCAQLWIVPVDGGEARELTRCETALPLPSMPVVSPDGRWIYYCQTGEEFRVWRMGIDGSDQRVLTTGPFDVAPRVSPDNQWVYFSSCDKGRCTPKKMKPDGSQVSPLSGLDFVAGDVSPDGTELLGKGQNDNKKSREVAVLPTTGGSPRLLGQTFPLAEDFLSITPDGAWVTYTRRQDGKKNLYGRPRRGGPERQITRFEDSGQIFAAAWSRDGRLAISRGLKVSDVVLIAAK